MTTFSVLTYFWHDILAAKRAHSNMELQEPSDFLHIQCIAQSSQFHAGMCTNVRLAAKFSVFGHRAVKNFAILIMLNINYFKVSFTI
jgi:hypothetical protein